MLERLVVAILRFKADLGEVLEGYLLADHLSASVCSEAFPLGTLKLKGKSL